MPTEYAPGETIIATESSDNKYGKTQDQFQDITQNTSIDQIQHVIQGYDTRHNRITRKMSGQGGMIDWN